MKNTLVLGALSAALLTACGANNKYECIERTQKDVANFERSGTHPEVDYVLLHDGHKIYASCDTTTIDDPDARCGFRPLRTYECTLDPKTIETGMVSDLKCKDADGHNVYLYVSKKE